MFSLTLVSPADPLDFAPSGADRRYLWGAVEEHETIRRVKIPHKEPTLSLQIHFADLCV